jgi:3-dehydroquinate synthase
MSQQSIFLYGPSGSGKSHVGKLLSESLKMPYVDLDMEIEARSGTSIPEIFASQGEAGFREWERQTLGLVLESERKIIALGGGALTFPENRDLAEAHGQVVLLHAPLEVLRDRLIADEAERPLLSENVNENLAKLLAKREEHYASFPIQVNTENMCPEAVAWEIQIVLGMFHLNSMATRQLPGYDVRVGANSLDQIGEMLTARDLGSPVMVISDENVGELYLARVTAALTKVGLETHGITIPAGEAHKTLETVSNLWDAFLSKNIERGSTVVGLGGGVVGDLAGFAAAAFKRGVPWVGVPTSLLAMVDASLGGKTGADLPQGKNLIGAFYPPRMVIADPEVLGTLPEEELISGMAEVIKHGMIADPDLLKLCQDFRSLENFGNLEQVVSRAMAVKIRIIEEDPYEMGIRAALNFGHTVGHGVELVSDFKLRHGEAVAVGMVIEARMAEEIGLATAGLAEGIATVLGGVGLPTKIPPELDRSAIVEAMGHDKKRAGGVVRFALPAAIGDVRVGVEVDDWEVMVRSH